VFHCDATISAQQPIRVRRIMRVLNTAAALSITALMIAGCANQPRIAFTEADQDAAVPAGMRGNIRYWLDAPASVFQNAPAKPVVRRGEPFIYLALSGGGGSGAYGAGILNGWTESGMRPEFTMVSGISTGALIAPFAFLGPSYDATLKQAYTSGEAEDLLRNPDPIGLLFGTGLYGRERLRRLVERYIDDNLLRAVAQEYQKGRRLFVVTTDLDAQRAVIWDMGAIAASGAPNAFKLFRDVLAASASIPVVFSPQLIDVEVNERRFQEMHVDGGVSTPFFTLPDSFVFGGTAVTIGGTRRVLYVIVNDRVEPTFEVVPQQTEAIGRRSVAAISRADTQAVLDQTYSFAQRQRFSFNLTYVGKDMPENGGTGYDTEYMLQLYRYGHDKALSGSFWEKKPLQLEAKKEAAKTVER
jgi:predicted acylesterase/phospholipase RssA